MGWCVALTCPCSHRPRSCHLRGTVPSWAQFSRWGPSHSFGMQTHVHGRAILASKSATCTLCIRARLARSFGAYLSIACLPLNPRPFHATSTHAYVETQRNRARRRVAELKIGTGRWISLPFPFVPRVRQQTRGTPWQICQARHLHSLERSAAAVFPVSVVGAGPPRSRGTVH